ncbi:hypothetical protein KCV07_g132, partial [Aureobasidium melanogenum]
METKFHMRMTLLMMQKKPSSVTMLGASHSGRNSTHAFHWFRYAIPTSMLLLDREVNDLSTDEYLYSFKLAKASSERGPSRVDESVPVSLLYSCCSNSLIVTLVKQQPGTVRTAT